MFGYVRAYKPNMTFAQYDIYKGVYCSLCKQTGKRYGIISRAALSYDFTFFALFRLALKNGCTQFHESRCSFNPLKKCYECNMDEKDIQLAADVSMLALYYKYIDNLNDTKGIKKFFLKLCSPYFKRIHKKAKANCPEGEEILAEMMLQQTEAEKSDAGIDMAAHPSAEALGRLLSIGCDDEDVYRFGYMTGRWVYIADAADDYKKDLKNGTFNPFASLSEDEAMKKAGEAMNLTLSEAVRLLGSIELNCYRSIILNIVCEGMHTVIKELTDSGRNTNE